MKFESYFSINNLINKTYRYVIFYNIVKVITTDYVGNKLGIKLYVNNLI